MKTFRKSLSVPQSAVWQ